MNQCQNCEQRVFIGDFGFVYELCPKCYKDKLVLPCLNCKMTVYTVFDSYVGGLCDCCKIMRNVPCLKCKINLYPGQTGYGSICDDCSKPKVKRQYKKRKTIKFELPCKLEITKFRTPCSLLSDSTGFNQDKVPVKR